MKKNHLIIIGIGLSVLLLLFMLIYRSSNGKDYIGDTQISIRVETGIKLPKVYLDSLLELVSLYEGTGTPIPYTQSSVSVYTSEIDSLVVSCPISGLNQFRTIFSNNFYSYIDREDDMRTMRLNADQFVGSFANNCPLPDKDAYIIVHCSLDSSNGDGKMYIADYSVATIKALVAKALAANMTSSNYIKIYFTTGEGKVDIPEGPYKGKDKGPKKGPGDEIIDGPVNGPVNEPVPEPEGEKPCKAKDVDAQILLQRGNPNVFSWNDQPGFTYDFTLVCFDGNCEAALRVNQTNVTGGIVNVEAAFAQATDIIYTATLIVKCKGKVVKKVTKNVKIVCAD
jgi:hypothetical protein